MKDIKNYEGLYAVTEDGKVWSYRKNRFLKPVLYNNGYLYVSFKRKRYAVHRLVAGAYLDNPNNYPEVNHKDENKLNNSLSNLEWCSHDYNTNYGTRTERIAKKQGKQVLCVELNRMFSSFSDAARAIGLKSHVSIVNCLRGRAKTAGGYHWEAI